MHLIVAFTRVDSNTVYGFVDTFIKDLDCGCTTVFVLHNFERVTITEDDPVKDKEGRIGCQSFSKHCKKTQRIKTQTVPVVGVVDISVASDKHSCRLEQNGSECHHF